MFWAVSETDKGMRVGADRFVRLLIRETYGAWHWLPVMAVYVLATLLTDAHFMGDTADYVDSIVAYERGRDYWFWEFGHVLWRPLGWAVMVLCRPLISVMVGPDLRLNALVAVIAINWITGLVSVLSLYGVLNQVLTRWWIAILTTSAFVFSHGFLNYSQTGCSYIPGLAFLLVSLYLVVRSARGGDSRIIWGILAGLSLAGALAMWIPLLLGIPAILLAPILLSGNKKSTWKVVLDRCGHRWIVDRNGLPGSNHLGRGHYRHRRSQSVDGKDRWRTGTRQINPTHGIWIRKVVYLHG